MATITEAQATIIRSVAVPLNAISILASLLIIFGYIYLVTHHPSSNRISLKLTVALATVDFFYSIFQIASDVITVDGFGCSFSVWGYVQFTLLGMLFTIALAFNLQLVFLNGRQDTTSYVRYYYTIPLALSLVLSTPAWIAGHYGWEPYAKTCWYRNDGTRDSFVLQWSTLYAWVLVTILYCAVIVVVVWIKIRRERLLLQQTLVFPGYSKGGKRRRSSFASDTEKISAAAKRERDIEAAATWRRRQAQMNLTRIVGRVVWYPLVPVITQTPNVLVAIVLYANKSVPFWLLLTSFIGTSVQGLLHLIAFSFDPAVRDAMDKREKVEKKRVRFDTIDEPLTLPEPVVHVKPKRSDTMDSVGRTPLPALAAWRFTGGVESARMRGDTVTSRLSSQGYFSPRFDSETSTRWYNHSFDQEEEDDDEYWLRSSMQIGMESIDFPHWTL